MNDTNMKNYSNKLIWLFAFTLISLTACSSVITPTPDAPNTPDVPPSNPTPSLIAASPTPVQAAAVVNGEIITLAAFQASLARFLDAQAQVGTLLATEDSNTRVLDELIDRLLLAQFARSSGFTAEDSLVEQRVEQLVEDVGGEEALAAWMAANYYSPVSFSEELRLELEAAWMRDQIIADVPESAKQVLARQVLLNTSFEAERLYNQLQSGTSFDIIVTNNDPLGLGYLGWFPHGYLIDQELEEAAFALQPGEYSQVIETRLGFHIIQVLDYDPDRELSADARLTFQTRLIQTWLDEKRSQSQIDIRLP
jgi:parvulin-like peptidyl-prolyl isomerase